MKNTTISPELKELIAGKSDSCVSLILPMNEAPSDFRINEIVTKQAYQKLEGQLSASVEAETADLIKDKLNSLKNQLSSTTGVKGLGVYLSEKISTIMTFPFEVTEKIVVGKSFEIRDMVQNESYLTQYFVLSVTKDTINFYRGSAGRLTEVNDRNFPIEAVGPEYQLPIGENQETQSAATAKREVLTTQSKTETFNLVKARLQEYLNENTPLILAGGEKEVAEIEKVLSHTTIIGSVKGTYSDYNFSDLEEKTWETMLVDLKKRERVLLNSLRETPTHLLSSGLQPVWSDAKSGKGKILLVEKDLVIPAWQGKDEFSLQLDASANSHPIPDAVDDLIETVLEKDGKVVMVDNGLLKAYQGVVMIKRYS